MSEVIVDDYYKRQAKDLINTLFDKRFLNDELSRESIDWLEEFMGLYFQQISQSSAKLALLSAKLRDK